MHSLPVFLRLAGRPVILIGEGEAADAKRRLLERAGALVVGGDDMRARIAIVAVDDDDAAEAAVRTLRGRGVLVNAVDRLALCDFTLPAIVDRDPVLIAIGSGGASAGLAKAVRQRIERLIPPGLGRLAEGLAAARSAMRARWPTPRARRAAIDAALAEGGMLDPLAPQDEDSVARWIETSDGTPDRVERAETIWLTSTDPDDLTLRAARWLGEADCIIHSPDIPATLLARARADATRIMADDPVATFSSEPRPGFTVILNLTPM